MNFCFYSKYNGKSTIEQLRRVTFLFSSSSFHIVYGNQDALLKKDLTIIQQFELIESIYNREHDQNTIDELFNCLNIKANLSQKYDFCSLGERI